MYYSTTTLTISIILVGLLSLVATVSLHKCRKQACVLTSAVFVLALGILSTVVFEQARVSEGFRKADLLLNANTAGKVDLTQTLKYFLIFSISVSIGAVCGIVGVWGKILAGPPRGLGEETSSRRTTIKCSKIL